jgi:TonB family protein
MCRYLRSYCFSVLILLVSACACMAVGREPGETHASPVREFQGLRDLASRITNDTLQVGCPNQVPTPLPDLPLRTRTRCLQEVESSGCWSRWRACAIVRLRAEPLGYKGCQTRGESSGSILVEGIVGLDGKITNIRILRRPGVGLNDNVLKTLKQWRCKPSTGPNGQPVLALVPFDINFRLY